MLRESKGKGKKKKKKLIKMFRHVLSTRESKQKDLTINDVKMLKCDSFTNVGGHFRQGFILCVTMTCSNI